MGVNPQGGLNPPLGVNPLGGKPLSKISIVVIKKGRVVIKFGGITTPTRLEIFFWSKKRKKGEMGENGREKKKTGSGAIKVQLISGINNSIKIRPA